MAIGRPSDYTAWKAKAICMRLANGESLRSICKRKYYPSRYAVFRWLSSNSTFRNQYALAREQQAELFLDEMLEMAEEPLNTEDSNVRVQRDKLGIDTRKWVMERLSAQRYGTKQAIDHTSSDGSMSPKEGLGSFYADIGKG